MSIINKLIPTAFLSSIKIRDKIIFLSLAGIIVFIAFSVGAVIKKKKQIKITGIAKLSQITFRALECRY